MITNSVGIVHDENAEFRTNYLIIDKILMLWSSIIRWLQNHISQIN